MATPPDSLKEEEIEALLLDCGIAGRPEPELAREGAVLAEGRYTLGAALGQGGMGKVFCAFDDDLKREVAIKFPLVSATTEPAIMRAAFAREARAVAKLDHPGIVKIHDFGLFNGLPFQVFERIKGSPVNKRGLPMRPLEALRVVKQIAAAVAYAHEHNVIHRDLKPSNALVDAEGHVWVLDFGLSSITAGSAGGPPVARGSRDGTPGYTAPEQWRGEVGTFCDVFAVGVILFELLTGRLPYPALNGETASTPQAADHFDQLPACFPPRFGDWLKTVIDFDLQRRPQLRDVCASLSAYEDLLNPRSVVCRARAMRTTRWGAIQESLAPGKLHLEDKSIVDLGSVGLLEGLTSLNLAMNPITDLRPLAGLTALEQLDLGWCPQLRDLSPLASLLSLRRIRLSHTCVGDIGPISRLPALEDFEISHTQVADLEPLTVMRVGVRLNLAGTRVANIAVLARFLHLRFLNLDGTEVDCVGPLRALTNLVRLCLRGTPISDVGPLLGMTRLEELDLRDTGPVDLGPVGALPNLRWLYVSSGNPSLAALKRARPDIRIGDETNIPWWDQGVSPRSFIDQ